MPRVAPCPYCGQTAMIPDCVDAEAIVRCPLCDYEFELGHALLNASEAPPEHIAELPAELVPLIPPTVAAESVAAVDSSQPGSSGDDAAAAVAIESPPVEDGLTSLGLSESPKTMPALGLRNKQPVLSSLRHLVGMIVSGLLGLALAYALLNWLGPRQLRFWNRPRPRAEGANWRSPRDATRLPEPGSDEEFPGVNEKSQGPGTGD